MEPIPRCKPSTSVQIASWIISGLILLIVLGIVFTLANFLVVVMSMPAGDTE